MFDNYVNQIDQLSFSDNDKQILMNILSNCQAPAATTRPVTLGGATNITGPTTINNITNISQILGDAGVPTFVRFRTTASLTLGGSAAAISQKYNGSGYIDDATITVQDFFGLHVGEWQAPSGYWGIGLSFPDNSTKVLILSMERQATFVAFTMTSNMSAGFASATFNSFWGGRSTGSETGVYDRQGLFSTATTGQKGFAVWDSKLGQYAVFHPLPGSGGGGSGNQVIHFTLDDDLTTGGSASATLAGGSSATVYDANDIGPALSSMIGTAYLSDVSGNLEIITLSRIARRCEFTAIQPMATTEDVTVVQATLFYDGVPPFIAPGLLEIWNSRHIFQLDVNSLGWGDYKPEEDVWEMTNATCPGKKVNPTYPAAPDGGSNDQLIQSIIDLGDIINGDITSGGSMFAGSGAY